ncbi:Aste57867_2600 [Aphanomyces stellatus]|uniref:Aste57867_2600 protein n=1 Tax=Aphanomyces stellatus TaxID=120398 RepID=A0A485KBN4_9STRA|nr:hypothetical protein As57867_002593 [Aphanomyces stellatus]VFT79796.1 Aste57867_2600 [Aphanomyces stellatus]
MRSISSTVLTLVAAYCLVSVDIVNALGTSTFTLDATNPSFEWQESRTLDEKKAMAIAFVEQQMEKYPIPGMALSVVYQNETVLAHGFGTKEFGKTDTPVTADTLFQIGSFSKSFIGLAIGTLVDQGKMEWNDPVKRHLPWLTLVDKYAERYTTLADLLSMNSVFGAYEGDVAWMMGVYSSERALVEHLDVFNTTRSFRAGWAYSNIGYSILGQVIEAATNQTWHDYVHDAILAPLGMKHTVAQAMDATPELLSSGHFYCNKKVAGPYDLFNDRDVALVPQNGLIAAGSIISSATDIAEFSKLLLRHGQGIIKNRDVFAAMITGHQIVPLSGPTMERFGYYGYEPSGRAVGSGYGFDFAGKIAFGLDYFSKNGGTVAFLTESAYVPSHELGVVLLSNASPQDGDVLSKTAMAQIRSYILGIFLDIPVAELDAWHQKAIDGIHATGSSTPCDAHRFDGESWGTPGAVISNATKQALVGTYQSTTNAFLGPAKIFTQGNDLMLEYGVYTVALLATSDPKTLIWNIGMAAAPLAVLGPGLVSHLGFDFVRQ